MDTAFAKVVVAKFRSGLSTVVILATFVPVLVSANKGSNDRTDIAVVHTLSLNRISLGSVFGIL